MNPLIAFIFVLIMSSLSSKEEERGIIFDEVNVRHRANVSVKVPEVARIRVRASYAIWYEQKRPIIKNESTRPIDKTENEKL